MKYKVKDTFRLDLFKKKIDMEDYVKEGVDYYAIGVIDTCLINKDTREISHMGVSLGMFNAVVGLIKTLGGLEQTK